MSKRNREKRAFRVQVPPPDVMFPIFARDFKRAEQIMLPELLKKAGLNPIRAITAIVVCANALETGKVSMETRMVRGGAELLKTLWQQGYYTPSPDYPFTLEETLSYASKEGQS